MDKIGQEKIKNKLQQNKILLSLLVIFKCILMIIPWFLEVRTHISIMRSITLVTRPIRLCWSWSWRGCRCQCCQQSTLRFLNFFSGRKACRLLQALDKPQNQGFLSVEVYQDSMVLLFHQHLKIYQAPIQKIASKTTERTNAHTKYGKCISTLKVEKFSEN